MIQGYYVPEVEKAINNTVFAEENRKIMRGLFIYGKTYEAQAYESNLSLRGLHKRVSILYPPVIDYLKKNRIN